MPIACFLISAFGIACERARQPDLAGKPLALTGEDAMLRVVSEEVAGVKTGRRRRCILDNVETPDFVAGFRGGRVDFPVTAADDHQLFAGRRLRLVTRVSVRARGDS